MADNLILVTVKTKTIGSDNIYRDNNIKPSNIVTYPMPQQQVVDILNLTTPIRYNTSNATTYFGVRDNASPQKENRNVGICYYTCTDTITTLANQSSGLVSLTVVKRRLEVIASEIMLFQTSKIIGTVDVDSVTGNSRFQYLEDGDPNLVMYEVTQTPAQIAASGINPVFSMNGYELYVNDIVGNDATAEFGNPLLPWATFDGAMTAAINATYFNVTIIITGGEQVPNNNAFHPNVNIEIRPAAELLINNYLASGSGNQSITGGGLLQLNAAILADSTYSGNIDINVLNIGVGGASAGGFINQSTFGGVIDVTCDYFLNACIGKTYSVTGTSNSGSLIINKKLFDGSFPGSTGHDAVISVFYINPSALITGDKFFKVKIEGGNSFASNEGVVCLANIDSTYNVDADINLDYNGSKNSPGLNAILSCYNCVGGVVNLRGTQYIITQGRCAVLVNSTISVYDYSNTYYTTSNPNPMIHLAGGVSLYTLYGKKFSNCISTLGSIVMGATFTSSSTTVDFGNVTGTAGIDTLHFKGGLKCTWLNNSAVGIAVLNANPNLVIDGGTIEMVQGNTATSSIKGTTQNMKVLGTGFVRGAVTGMTNTITGTNIIQDIGVTVNM